MIIVLVFATLGLLLGSADYIQRNSANSILTLDTDKQEYSRGEKVTFLATNQGGKRLLFAYGSLQLALVNLDTNQRYHVISAQVYNALEPGQSKTIVWNEKRDGKLEPGNYVATIHTTAAGGRPMATAEANFLVS